MQPDLEAGLSKGYDDMACVSSETQHQYQKQDRVAAGFGNGSH
jgi:hypothetical protein